jgi:hypothetical protein
MHEAVLETSLSKGKRIPLLATHLAAGHYSPHFAPASEILERLRRSDAKYVSTEGALVIRVRLVGVSRREKIEYAILLRGTLFSP